MSTVSTAARALQNGDALPPQKIGKYQLIKELGKGATSEVFLALDPFANRKVALKVVQREVLGDKEHGRRFRKLFLTEASLTGKLAHPHIVAIYDAVADDEGSYIVMEYVEGGTLEQFTKVDNLLPVNKIIEIVFKCCKALDYAHRYGVIHRDIKPANILLSKDTDIKISDFGAALTTAVETTQVTGIGSPAYMSPEQVQEQQLTHQTDIFSLGVVMYQLLTGSLPFKATNNYSMVFQIINVDPPPPSIFRPEIPASIDHIVKKALQKRLEGRYPTWEEFAQDLVRVFNNLQTPEQPVPDTEKFNTLRRLDFFRNFTDVDLWQVLHISNWNRIPAGTTLIREGETGTSFFILAAGEVRVTRAERLRDVLRTGECFGEMAYLGRRQFKRSASVTASTEITAIEIKSDALNAATESCRHHFTAAFLELLVARLAAADVRLSWVEFQDPAHLDLGLIVHPQHEVGLEQILATFDIGGGQITGLFQVGDGLVEVAIEAVRAASAMPSEIDVRVCGKLVDELAVDRDGRVVVPGVLEPVGLFESALIHEVNSPSCLKHRQPAACDQVRTTPPSSVVGLAPAPRRATPPRHPLRPTPPCPSRSPRSLLVGRGLRPAQHEGP